MGDARDGWWRCPCWSAGRADLRVVRRGVSRPPSFRRPAAIGSDRARVSGSEPRTSISHERPVVDAAAQCTVTASLPPRAARTRTWCRLRAAVDLEALLDEQLFDIAVGPPEPQVPAHRYHAHLGREAEPADHQGREAEPPNAGHEVAERRAGRTERTDRSSDPSCLSVERNTARRPRCSAARTRGRTDRPRIGRRLPQRRREDDSVPFGRA